MEMEWIYVVGLKQKEQNGVDLCYGLEAERTEWSGFMLWA
jgi:hypothetical protein